jgi:hypothetical protein
VAQGKVVILEDDPLLYSVLGSGVLSSPFFDLLGAVLSEQGGYQ